MRQIHCCASASRSGSYEIFKLPLQVAIIELLVMDNTQYQMIHIASYKPRMIWHSTHKGSTIPTWWAGSKLRRRSRYSTSPNSMSRGSSSVSLVSYQHEQLDLIDVGDQGLLPVQTWCQGAFISSVLRTIGSSTKFNSLMYWTVRTIGKILDHYNMISL